jgi:ribA/ribD-fused uncharacterized protein
METANEIYFFRESGKYGSFSNFYPSKFVEGNIEFNCSEQYFMYYKCLTFDTENKHLLEAILNEKSPSKIKNFGRQVKNYNDKIWSEKRYSIMINALGLKFTQNKEIKDLLISTKEKILFEASPFDKIWGIGFDGKTAANMIDKTKFGKNLLGQALMQIRDSF